VVAISTRTRLQEARLWLWGLAFVAALGCADAGARLAKPAPWPREPRPAEAPAAWVRYVVQPGDTLGRIAACRGTSVAALARANRVSAPDRLLAGAMLRVPEADGCAGPPGPVASPRSPPGAGADVHRTVTDLLARALARYDAADFEEALALSQAGVVAIEPHPGGAETDALRARCHMVSGMAAAGLGRREHAIAEFREALAFAPDLPLDPERSSPRDLELVEAARVSPGAGKAPFVDSSTR